jgi:flagellar hook-basal body complex protein FliE
MKPNLTNLKPTLTIPNNQEQIKNVQQEVANLSPKIIEPQDGGFLDNIKAALENVSDNQKQSAELTKNFELGIENDLTKVMIQQQLASLGFQMTLNVRNKVLSAYKDIMNMPV